MSISTLGEAIGAAWHLFASCDCGLTEQIDTRALLWTRGMAFPLDMMSSRLRCPKCGGRSVRVHWTVPSAPQPAAGGRYLIELLDTSGDQVEAMTRDRFDAAARLFERTVRRRPGASVVFRDGGRIVRTWPERGS